MTTVEAAVTSDVLQALRRLVCARDVGYDDGAASEWIDGRVKVRTPRVELMPTPDSVCFRRVVSASLSGWCELSVAHGAELCGVTAGNSGRGS